MNKIFTNQELKQKITDLYKQNDIIIPDDIQHKINKSSKTRYDILIKIYDEIKDYKKPEKILIDV